MSSLVFVDTWAWLALALRRDQFHEAAKRRHASLRAAGRRYVTSDYILCELVTQLFRTLPANQAEQFCAVVLQSCTDGTFQLEQITSQRFANAWELRRQYVDKPRISFVDFTTMAVMKEMDVTEIFTGDAHFLQVNLDFQILD
jgi:predicted nucleic acid-binding protein